MKNFKLFLTEGGNISVNGAAAEPMDLKKTPRVSRQQDVHDMLHALNNSFITKHGDHLFGPKGESINSGSAFAGSSKDFMDPKIKDQEYVKHKPSVGDIDVMVPGHHKDNLDKHLKVGTRFGKFTLAGTKKHGNQISGIFKHDDGQHHQIDFEPAEYEGSEPSQWNQFSHSSNWNDTKSGVKGVFHKFALSALTAANGRQGRIKSKKGDQDGYFEDHSFSVQNGLRKKHEQVGDEEGVPLLKEINPKDAKYTTNVPDIYKTLIGKNASRQDLDDFGHFHGVLDLAKKHLTKDQQSRVVDKFIHTLYNPGKSQMIEKDHGRDSALKEKALSYMRKKFPHHFTEDREAELHRTRDEFYRLQREKELAKHLKEK